MAKLTLSDLASLTNETSAIATLNDNWALIEAAMELTLTRTGTTPNTMEAQLDMNSNRILNVPDPVDAGDPINKQYADDNLGGAALSAAQAAADAAAASATAAGTSASTAATDAATATTQAAAAAASAAAAAASAATAASASITYTVITAAGTVNNNSHNIVDNATAFALTLASDFDLGHIIRTNDSSGDITISHSTKTINGEASYVLKRVGVPILLKTDPNDSDNFIVSGGDESYEYNYTINDFAGTTFTQKMNAAIAFINSTSNVSIFIPPKATTYTITTQLDEITGTQFRFYGGGRGTRIAITANTGNFLRFGNTTTEAIRGSVHDMNVVVTGTASQNEFLFDHPFAQGIDIYNFYVSGLCGLARYGDGTRDANRCNLDNIQGNNGQGYGTPAIHLETYAMIRIDRVSLSDTSADVTRTGSNLLIAGRNPSTDFGDTTYISNLSLLSWNEGQADHKPYAIEVDTTECKQVNVWIDKMIGDHTGVAAVYIHGTGSADITCLKITNGRFSTDAGKGARIDYDGSDVARNILIQSNLFFVQDGDEHLRLEGTGTYSGCFFIDNDLSESGGAPARVRSILVANGSGWTIDRNKLSNRAGAAITSGTVRGIVISDTDLDNSVITHNDFSIVTTEAVSYPTFASISPLRIIKDNYGPTGPENEPPVTIASAATVNLAQTANPVVSITGTTTITSFGTGSPEGTVKHLLFAGALTITQSATILTTTGNDITTAAGMGLTAVKTSAGWTLIGVDGNVARTNGTNTFTGAQTASTAPTAGGHLTNKTYVDGLAPTSSAWTTYGETLTWVGSTAPSGTPILEYSWHRSGDLVHVKIKFEWTVAGSGLTQVRIPFPAALPTPDYPSGVNTNEVFGMCLGELYGSLTDAPAASARAVIRKDASNDPEVHLVGGTTNVTGVLCEFSYVAV